LQESNHQHLDADLAAAFCANVLDERERSQVFEHLAGCATCREWIRITADLKPSEQRRMGIAILVPVAAGIVCAVFAAWFVSTRPSHSQAHEIAVESYVQAKTVVAESAGSARFTRVRVRPHAERTVQLPATLLPIGRDPDVLNPGLPLAWQRITIASAMWRVPAANQFSLRTTVGEKWITLAGLWKPGTGVR
jgi:hypothetical protein